MALIIGLTGGIGSGKTAVSDHFETLGITVVDADLASRVVVEKGKPALKEISNHFGNSILTNSGELDRAQLRQKIFSDASEKQWLEQLLHPLIREEITKQLGESQSPYTLFVSPLLIETDQHLLVNRVLVVDAPEEAQLQRTMNRDQNSADQVKAIMSTQSSRQQRQNKADDILVNDGSLDELHQKIEILHQQYLSKAQ